ncbi:MAG: MarC family protein, partial [Thermofilaceae archaeon]
DLKQLWDSFAMLFIVLDSVGNVPIFYALTSTLSEAERNRIFTKSIVIASIMLLTFALTGGAILDYYGVSMADFRIAGGLVLLLIALFGIFGRIEAETLRSEQVAVVPMATPLLAGPGSLYTVIYLSRVYGTAPTLASIVLNTLAAYAILRASGLILEKAGKNTVLALSRIFSLLLAVLAVSIIRSGFAEALAELSLKDGR